ncbi:hypothetical protein ACH5RR_029935 [Cinchona calisaya]|uniref:Uncharacterized protein n=1 Tax=Cinchona calisaya TaxID=153742 RepID=A0ABD2YWB8_9GENT
MTIGRMHRLIEKSFLQKFPGETSSYGVVSVQFIDPGPFRLSLGKRSSKAYSTLGSSSEAMSADVVGELGQSLYRPDLRKRILFSGIKFSFAQFDIGRSPTILDLSNSGVDPSMTRSTKLSIGRPISGKNYEKGLLALT